MGDIGKRDPRHSNQPFRKIHVRNSRLRSTGTFEGLVRHGVRDRCRRMRSGDLEDKTSRGSTRGHILCIAFCD